jgi:prepilin-type N-terminal cleavage/methylation domain-containing protein
MHSGGLVPRSAKREGGFTLLEILTVISIIGLISTIGTVSYQSALASARDTKRANDVQAIYQALELFFETNQYYPYDDVPGSSGLALGVPETHTLSDGGFAPAVEGLVYMETVPANPTPNGIPYTYRSLNKDGTDCNQGQCDSFALLFSLEKGQGSWLSGPHAITPEGIVGGEGGFGGLGVTGAGGTFMGLEIAKDVFSDAADRTTQAVIGFAQDDMVEDITEKAVAPAAAAAAAANTVAAAQATTSVAFGQYLAFFLTQPVLLLRRRRRKQWGTVYNTLSRLPEDLVIVRLREAESGKLVRSEVTDKDGRFGFIVPEGRYVLEVAKSKVVFPSRLTADMTEDGQYLDLYHGEAIDVGPEGGIITPSVPVDPDVSDLPDAALVKTDRWRKFQEGTAALGPLLGGFSLAIKPSALTAALFVFQLAIYLFFRRFVVPVRPKNWGTAYDDSTGKPVVQAVLRIFALPYHKLLESKVTDAHGRYNFRVGNAKYYLTATRHGYLKTETEPMDFSMITKPMFVAADIPLRRETAVKPEAGSGKAGKPESGKAAGVEVGKSGSGEVAKPEVGPGQASGQPPIKPPSAPEDKPPATPHRPDLDRI